MLCDKNEFIVITSPAIFDDAEFVQAALIGEAVEIQVSAYNDGESKHYSKYYSKDTAREILLKLVEKNAVPDISDYMQGQF